MWAASRGRGLQRANGVHTDKGLFRKLSLQFNIRRSESDKLATSIARGNQAKKESHVGLSHAMRQEFPTPCEA